MQAITLPNKVAVPLHFTGLAIGAGLSLGGIHVKTEMSYVSYDKNFDQLQTSLSILYTF